MTNSIIDDLYRYNSWANARIFALCDGLADAKRDEPREIGLGTLRNTMFHILAAEEIWLERWSNVPWRSFPFDAQGLAMSEIARRLDDVSSRRRALMDRERDSGWHRICQYKDSKGNLHTNRLDGLLLHVANHGIHHRAQALHFLKHFGRTVPGGLDYSFFRFANSHVKQEPATIDAMRQFGLEVDTGSSPAVDWDADVIRNYFAYGDWANRRLLDLLAPLDDATLDRSWGMGMDTIRKTVLHLADAERWWLSNWTSGPAPFEKAAETTSIAAHSDSWSKLIADRNRFIDTLDAESAQRVVTAIVGRMSIRVPVIESLVQLCGHGTHHRAQLINMLRHSGVTAKASDYVVWLREH
jgi:uncharacterized damage-inducible protein DinB